MCGDPDVLEYYRSQRASKPIRAIDLRECAVWRHAGPGPVRKEFQNHFVFVVQTAARTFYLVAKTEDEMQRWLRSITQVCNLGPSEAGAESVESLSRTPSSRQPSPASSVHAGQAVGPASPREDTSTGTVATEETRSESEFLFLPDYLVLSNCETGRPHRASLPSRCDSCSNSDRSLEQTSFDDVFVDGPPPPSAVSRPDVFKGRNLLQAVFPTAADVGDQPLRHRDKRLSLNLPSRFSPMCAAASSGVDDSYVPMQAAASSQGPPCSPDEYIPMSSGLLSPLPALPVDLQPPPVNRDLKPQRKSRPPPLDLQGLSTIREHAALSRARTVPGNRSSLLSPERNGFSSARFFASPAPREEEGSYTRMEEHRTASSLMWSRTCGLDYLALDFNSASPAPVQQKPLAEEQRVDYVQVDEQRTQALQSTRREWTDERRSKADSDERAPPGQP
ncbi:PREDICTED: GRB2-associated-binding protein 3 [Condylura cristata]|uniref:GRB2-associated-binding protein 3 n=1 Tax=Condylura cristata TaxID=143302 RepID=UPI00064375A4|nr:PREDICTED: GRB2-associated-binding protein 3 [Condylura cristata]